VTSKLDGDDRAFNELVHALVLSDQMECARMLDEDLSEKYRQEKESKESKLELNVISVYMCVCKDALTVCVVHKNSLTSTWPHLRCDVGLEEGEYREKLSLCYSIVYYYNGAQRYEQFLQVGWLYRALILLGLALNLPSTSVSLVFVDWPLTWLTNDCRSVL